MILEQMYLGCLSQASYLIGDPSTGVAAIVDPRRDVDEYLARAEQLGLRIEHAVLTHFHADFASGHLELRERCGATIYLGAGAEADYPFTALAEGDAIVLGQVSLRALSTPGHTPESMSYLVFDAAQSETEPQAVLTGDTLFIGDVGRPDLLGSVGVTAEEMAGRMFDSLRQKLMTLPPATVVYPGHGAGSMCGKNLSSETWSTIGEQLASNCALQPMPREDFVAMLTANQPQAPGYFGYDVRFNKQDHPVLDEARAAALRPLSVVEFLAARTEGAQVLDARDAEGYAACHLRGSVGIGLSGKFATWAGTVLSGDRSIVVVCDPGDEGEVVTRLGRIGFDRVLGFLDGGFDSLRQSAAAASDLVRAGRVTAAELPGFLRDRPGSVLLDVRTPGEREAGAIEDSLFIPLNQLQDRRDEVSAVGSLAIYCGGGYRSVIAMGLLETGEDREMVDLVGGWTAWAREKGLG